MNFEDKNKGCGNESIQINEDRLMKSICKLPCDFVELVNSKSIIKPNGCWIKDNDSIRMDVDQYYDCCENHRRIWKFLRLNTLDAKMCYVSLEPSRFGHSSLVDDNVITAFSKESGIASNVSLGDILKVCDRRIADLEKHCVDEIDRGIDNDTASENVHCMYYEGENRTVLRAGNFQKPIGDAHAHKTDIDSSFSSLKTSEEWRVNISDAELGHKEIYCDTIYVCRSDITVKDHRFDIVQERIATQMKKCFIENSNQHGFLVMPLPLCHRTSLCTEIITLLPDDDDEYLGQTYLKNCEKKKRLFLAFKRVVSNNESNYVVDKTFALLHNLIEKHLFKLNAAQLEKLLFSLMTLESTNRSLIVKALILKIANIFFSSWFGFEEFNDPMLTRKHKYRRPEFRFLFPQTRDQTEPIEKVLIKSCIVYDTKCDLRTIPKWKMKTTIPVLNLYRLCEIIALVFVYTMSMCIIVKGKTGKRCLAPCDHLQFEKPKSAKLVTSCISESARNDKIESAKPPIGNMIALYLSIILLTKDMQTFIIRLTVSMALTVDIAAKRQSNKAKIQLDKVCMLKKNLKDHSGFLRSLWKSGFASIYSKSLKNLLYGKNFKPSDTDLWVSPATRNSIDPVLCRFMTNRPPSRQETMSYELLRLCTMHDFPNPNGASFLRLAQAGFYYAGNGNELVCFSCGCKRSDWTNTDDSLTAHQALSPNCTFLNSQTSANMPVRYMEDDVAEQVLSSRETASSNQNLHSDSRLRNTNVSDCPQGNTNSDSMTQTLFVDGGGTIGNNTTNETEPIATSRYDSGYGTSSGSQNRGENYITRPLTPSRISTVAYPAYKEFSKRLDTFGLWPKHMRQNPRDLAQCGLFYTGKADCVRCFQCGIGLKNWDPDDNSWVEHARWSNKCQFLIQIKGQDFIDLVMAATRNADAEEDEPRNETDVSRPSRQTNTNLSIDAANASNDITTRNPTTVLMDSTSNDETSRNQSCAISNNTDIGYGSTSDVTSSNSQAAGQNVLTKQSASSKTSVAHFNKNTEQMNSTSGPNTKAHTNSAKPNTKPTNQVDKTKEKNIESSDSAYGSASSKSNTSLVSPRTSNCDNEKLKKEIKEMKDLTICKICLDAKVSIVFLPCGHLVSCAQCSPALRKCPICRQHIKGTVRTQV